MSVVRILIWNLADSKTSLDEMPDLQPLRALIGKEPDVAEEFDEVD